MPVTDSETSGAATNAPAWSVSELSAALKRTLEDAYGYVRIRGEVSKVTRHSSGHVYLTLKDERAAIDGVVWKGVVRQLKVQPEQGMEVIATGKITTYPASSKYQIVIDSLEAAGVGALLAQLERLKAKLAAEGLYEERRKRPLPRSPRVIGVITSPTGAVVRDILHRIRDRWPCRVLVWPVVVQGDQAPPQVIAAIRGFNALAPDGPVPRPDVLIVARGGGSVEDLWAFNDEALARAAADSAIPLVSAVGHETDTTLIDFVSDRRAPTPTGAAEMVTPVLAELRAALSGLNERLLRSGSQGLDARRTKLQAIARGLPRPTELLAGPSQRFDLASGGLRAGLERNVAAHDRELARVAGRFAPGLLDRPRRAKADRVADLGRRMAAAAGRVTSRAKDRARLPQLAERMRAGVARGLDLARGRLAAAEQLRVSLDPDRPLRKGFARVHDAADRLVTSAAALAPGDAVKLVFGDGERGAVISGGTPARAPKPKAPSPGQGDLF